MEGYLESFIYVLITIVILVLSIRKKRPVQSAGNEEPQPGDPFKELFGDEDYNDDQQTSTVSVENDSGSSEQFNPWVSEAEVRNLVLDADAVMKEAAENNPIAQFDAHLEDDAYDIDRPDHEGISFDLKKAVIYSEIMERRVI